ncbi:hypothetical protein H5410_029298 [Solanum commersonii]|uniref:Uncharacterized protein n=1 Tax=Solanum commersonii TaxID=4109 RepID=A0A9J5ZA47_SOLCO|nr:hypothetical protein H5410_029298 [Solanum commersonii]
MEPVVPHSQNLPISRSNGLQKLWSQLALSAKMCHFEGHISTRAGKPTIFPIFRWSQLSLTARTSHFQGQIDPGSGKHRILPIFVCYRPDFMVIWNFDVIFTINFTLTSVKTFAMETIGHHTQTDPFTRSNNPRNSWSLQPKQLICKVKRSPEQVNPHFDDLEFGRHFCQNFTWTFIKTLIMEPVNQHGQNGPFTRCNEPRSRLTPHFADFQVL